MTIAGHSVSLTSIVSPLTVPSKPFLQQLNQGNINTPTIPESQAGYYLQLNNVTITGGALPAFEGFPGGAINNETALPNYIQAQTNENNESNSSTVAE